MKASRKPFLFFALAAAALALAALVLLRTRPGAAGAASGAETGLSLTALLGEGGIGSGRADSAGAGPAAAFRKVTGPRPLAFPADHGPHPEYRSEWWYFTGNLEDSLGREFGYQLTFFRSGLRPPARDSAAEGAAEDAGAGARIAGETTGGRTSPWAAGDAYMAHFALTDADAGGFEAHERFSRAALGLAGAEAGSGMPFRVWLEDWSAAAQPGPEGTEASEARDRAVLVDGGGIGEPDFLPLRLRAAQGSIAIDLVLRSGKPRVLQGDSGYSRKGPEPGNASLYYSYTRLPTAGRLRTARGEFTVTGTSWLDREWGSSLLSPGLAGWEWFGLRLADSTDWTFFRLRKSGREAAAGDTLAFDYGLRVDAAGRTRVLVRLVTPTAYGPVRWRLHVPSESLEMEIAPVMAGQELRLSIPYWEGAVRIQARREGREIAGRGYMELTGY